MENHILKEKKNEFAKKMIELQREYNNLCLEENKIEETLPEIEQVIFSAAEIAGNSKKLTELIKKSSNSQEIIKELEDDKKQYIEYVEQDTMSIHDVELELSF